MADLELGFWDASVVTRPMLGAVETLAEFRRLGIAMGVVSNSSFSQVTIRHELAKHGLAEYFPTIVVSAEYAVRKPNPLIYDAAARLLDVPCSEIWFVGDRLDTDVAGATAAGMTPIWLAPSGGTDRRDRSHHDQRVVSSWSAGPRVTHVERRGHSLF